MVDNNGEGPAAGENRECKAAHHHHHHLHTTTHSHGAKARRARRLSKKNQTAINFLRRFAIGVVLIDLSIAICESNLISTFLLFLTLSSTFEVKPENVIESYCYYQPTGNRMCEDYMGRMMAYSPLHRHQSGNDAGSSDATASNHFPSVPNKPSFSQEESYKLFLAYNQSFYDTPAKFKIQQNLGQDCEFAKLYGKLTQVTVENHTGIRIPQQNFAEVVQQMNRFYTSVQLTKQLASVSAPSFKRGIPQVMDAIDKGIGMKKPPPTSQERKDFISYREKLRHSVEANHSPIVLNEKYKNLIQIKDFIRHRWKRSAAAVGKRRSGSTATGTEASVTSPQALVAPIRRPQGNSEHSSLNEARVTSGGGSGETKFDEKELTQRPTADHPSQNTPLPSGLHPTLVQDAVGNKGQTKGSPSPGMGNESGNRPETSARGNEIKSQVESEKSDTVIKGKRVGEGNHHHHPLLVENTRSSHATTTSPQKTGRGNVERMDAERKLHPCTNSNNNDHEAVQTNWKNFLTILTLLEKGPRDILGLMESSLYNNWHCFLEAAKSYMAPGQKQDKVSADTGLKCDSQVDKELEKLFKSVARNSTRIVPSVGLDMNIFSPETYTKAERRRRAIAQIYHDYGCSIMGQLSGFEEMPVSRSLTMMHWTVKIYSLLWHVAICCILFYGSVFEDKTALHIWGILNILTSLIHFMIEDWINSTFHPEKSAMAIWFFVVYGLYKPMTILLVGTLASEILKKDGFLNGKGMFSSLLEVIRGRKPPAAPTSSTAGKNTSDISGHFFLISSAKSSRCGMEAEKNMQGINGAAPCPMTKLRMKVNRATVDTEGNLIMYVHEPPVEGIESGTCVICGEKITPIVELIQREDKRLQEEFIKEQNERLRELIGHGYFCKRLRLQDKNGHLAAEELFTLTDDDNDDDYEIETVADDEDSEDDEEEEEEDNDNQGQRIDMQKGKEAPSAKNNASSVAAPSAPEIHPQQPELPSRVVVVSDRGPRNNDNGNVSELSPETPPPAYVNDPAQLRSVYEDPRFRNPIDGLIMPPVPDRVDGLYEAPIDGESQHI